MTIALFTDEQTIAFINQAEAGMSIKELSRSGGFSQPSESPWITMKLGAFLSHRR